MSKKKQEDTAQNGVEKYRHLHVENVKKDTLGKF